MIARLIIQLLVCANLLVPACSFGADADWQSDLDRLRRHFKMDFPQQRVPGPTEPYVVDKVVTTQPVQMPTTMPSELSDELRDLLERSQAAAHDNQAGLLAALRRELQAARAGKVGDESPQYNVEAWTRSESGYRFPNSASKQMLTKLYADELRVLSTSSAVEGEPEQLEFVPIRALDVGEMGQCDQYIFEVQNVVDDRNVILRWGQDKGFWLQGVPTSGLIDNQNIKLDMPVAITGTRQYETVAGGVATVFEMVPVDLSALEPFEPSERQKEAAAKKAADRAAAQEKKKQGKSLRARPGIGGGY